MIHGIYRLKWNYCTQIYKSIGGRQNIGVNLIKDHGCDSLTTV